MLATLKIIIETPERIEKTYKVCEVVTSNKQETEFARKCTVALEDALISVGIKILDY